ncbi:MAG TPA: N-acetylmuramoyl-L-alanine amidase [Actinomycetota bacterium]|nr:N-acetylmuramoyl-L-alanine amidase [Actinomycetota bacterium]
MTLLSFAGSPHGGSHKLLPEWQSQPRITPVLIIDHSIVGSALGAWWYFHDSTGIESHFIIRGRRSGSADGHIWQLMDTDRRADANWQANDKAISIETEDDGDPDTQPWTTAQLQSLIWLHNKLARIYPTIRRREASDCDGPGLGYHSKLGTPSCWTPVAGKLLAVDTPIPTPEGLRPLHEITVGATVFDERGEPCRVTGVYDDMPERAWRLRFDDGLEVLAGGEHQWVTITRGQRKGYFRRDRPRDLGRGPRPEGYPLDWAPLGAVRDTDEIASTLREPDGGYRHTIPVARPLRLAPQDLPVDPYLLGTWLGDGVALGRKYVPGRYLLGSAEQRLALLQGLMDTDGSASDRSHVEFTSTSEELADAVVWLASSLGQRVRKGKGEATLRGVSFGPKYRVGWSPTIPVFRLPRKLARLRKVPSVRSQGRAIVACEPAPIQPMRCLTVDSPNSVYLITDRCLPTHNTCPGRPVRVRQWRQTLLPAFLHPEEDDFMALFDNVDEFKAAVRAVVRDEVHQAYEALARGEINNRIDPTSQHFQDSHRGLYRQMQSVYEALARGEINDRIDPTSQHYKDSHRALYELLVAVAAATGAQPPQPPPAAAVP